MGRVFLYVFTGEGKVFQDVSNSEMMPKWDEFFICPVEKKKKYIFQDVLAQIKGFLRCELPLYKILYHT